MKKTQSTTVLRNTLGALTHLDSSPATYKEICVNTNSAEDDQLDEFNSDLYNKESIAPTTNRNSPPVVEEW